VTETKTCCKCKTEKPKSEFYGHKTHSDRLSHACKLCDGADRKAYYGANKEAIRARKKEYRDANKEALAEKNMEYYAANKESICEQKKEYYEANKEAISVKNREYGKSHREAIAANKREYRKVNEKAIGERNRAKYEANRESICEQMKEYYMDNRKSICERSKEYQRVNKEAVRKRKAAYRKANRETINSALSLYKRNRRKTDPLFALTDGIRTLIARSLTRCGYSKKSKTYEILGCSCDEFRIYIENQFLDGMGWHNRSEWHLDHIYPVSKAADEDHLLALNHYTNFQPLWALDNMRKGNKIPESYHANLSDQ
jgi:hypothetical protein